ncbi:hypothetical protein POVWA2_027850 [Plasmodium ovale wallikeri]|uniref:Uncharacterized protein n=1 Tax=Plasmodium ovale wallikeri TaxID=864142 RepID=A0A1A8YWR8_PLAOA|nr:hypothetical protein POVWA2_027850 [Plasmodium ovale wallikeri]SBT53984.1 hypothetical protein POVWA1_065290 [Plasmodium ovale wallikeri]
MASWRCAFMLTWITPGTITFPFLPFLKGKPCNISCERGPLKPPKMCSLKSVAKRKLEKRKFDTADTVKFVSHGRVRARV